MSFFFEELPTAQKKKTSQNLDPLLYQQGCKLCPLNNRKLKSPKMKPTGNNTASVYVLGEAPGRQEDIEDRQFVGKAGQRFRKSLIPIFSETYIEKAFRWNNVVRCRTSDTNRDPTHEEMQCCRKSIEDDIEKTKPLVIIGTGNIPLKWMVDGIGISALWRGRQIPVKIKSHICWFFPILHPQFINYEEDRSLNNEWSKVFDRDLENITDVLNRLCLDSHLPQNIVSEGYDDNIEIILEGGSKGVEWVEKVLEEMKKFSLVGIDIENWPLKPWESKDSKWLSIAISSLRKTIAYPVEYQDFWGRYKKDILKLTKEFLLHSGLKITHNFKHEATWLNHYYGQEVLRETEWGDTLAQAYLLDERTLKRKNMGMFGLGRLTLLHMGFDIKKLSNLNMDDARRVSLDKLLLYNGRDAKYTRNLYIIQDDLLPRSLRKLYEQHIETAKCLALTETIGVVVNEREIDNFEKIWKKEKDIIDKKIKETKEAKKYKNRFGTDLNPSSGPQVIKLFRDVLKLKKLKTVNGKKESYAVDEYVLKHFAENGIEIATLIMKYKEYKSLISKYCDGIRKLLIDKKLHTDFNAMYTNTSRFASSKPNLQNFDKKKHPESRKIIIVSKSDWFVSVDLGQIEARVIAMFSKDKKFMTSLFNGYDIHLEQAKKTAKAWPNSAGVNYFEDLTKEGLKKFRDSIKSDQVFPWFYLATPYSVGETLGIPKRVIEKLYDDFWVDFAGVKEWQKKVIDFYNENGYVESLTGRRRRAPLEYTMLSNTPVQSTAASIIIESGNRLSLIGYEQKKIQYQYKLQIHDDLSFTIPDKHLDRDIEVIGKEMVRPAFDFINVPLTAEVSVGKNWYELEKLHTFDTRDFFKMENKGGKDG